MWTILFYSILISTMAELVEFLLLVQNHSFLSISLPEYNFLNEYHSVFCMDDNLNVALICICLLMRAEVFLFKSVMYPIGLMIFFFFF